MNDNPRVVQTVDEAEQRLRAALHARSAQVTEETLQLPSELPRPGTPKRWPLLAAAAAVVVIGLVAALLATDFDRRTTPANPPPARDRTTSIEPAPARCAQGTRCVVQTVEVDGQQLQLVGTLLDRELAIYQDWVLRVRGGAEIARGAAGDSGQFLPYVGERALVCKRFEQAFPMCLLATSGIGDTFTAVWFSQRGQGEGWQPDLELSLSLFTESLHLSTLDGESAPVAISVEHDEIQSRWHARVWRWDDGKALGCTPYVHRAQDLPGWPDVTPERSTLSEDCGGYLPLRDGTPAGSG